MTSSRTHCRVGVAITRPGGDQMPVYTYYCHRCLRRTSCVGGVDDGVVLCPHCGRPMWRRGDMNSILASYDGSL